MKKIIQESVREESKYFCDKHPDRECYSEIRTISWYGSLFDMMGLEIHLCDECLENMYKVLESEFSVKPKELEI
jgi:hypothetical protein